MEAVDEGQVAHRHPFRAGPRELRQDHLQVGGARLIVGRDEQGLAQVLGRFVHGEARRIGRIFEERPGRFAHIERHEVLAVMDRGRPVMIAQREPHRPHRLDVGGAEGHVVEHPRPLTAGHEPGRATDVHHIAVRRHADERTVAALLGIAEAVQEARHRLGIVGQDRHPPDPGRRGRIVKRRLGRHVEADQLHDDPVRVAQAQHALAHLLRGAADRHARPHRPRQPFAEAARRDGKGDLGDLPQTHAPCRPVLPHEKRHDRARAAQPVAVEQVKLLGVLVPAGLLDQPQAQKTRIEIHVLLDVAGQSGDVVDAGRHAAASRASTRCTASSAARRSCSACTFGKSAIPPGSIFTPQRIIGNA